MIKVTTFVLRLATAILSMGVVYGVAYGTGQLQATGSLQFEVATAGTALCCIESANCNWKRPVDWI